MKAARNIAVIVAAAIVAVALLLLALGAEAQTGSRGITVKKGQWVALVIIDTNFKPTFYDTSFSPSPDTVLYPVYLHDTIRIHDTSYVQFITHDTLRFTDTIRNCGVPPVPTLVTIFTTQVPPTSSQTDGQPITLGVKFRSSVTAYAKGIRFAKTTANTGTHIGYLYNLQGVLLDSGIFVNETASGWQTLTLTKNVQLSSNTTYIAAYYSPTGQYSSTNNTFNTAITNGIITGLASGTVGVNGVYSYGNKFPTLTYQNSNYWVDAVLSQTK